MNRVYVAYAFIFNEIDEKVLMVKNKGGGWSLPGGAIEKVKHLNNQQLEKVREKQM